MVPCGAPSASAGKAQSAETAAAAAPNSAARDWLADTARPTPHIAADASAYGSCVWVLLGLHTFNLVTDVGDTIVIAAVMFKKAVDGKRFVDVAENAGYWWFIIGSWIPIYAVVYLAPRM